MAERAVAGGPGAPGVFGRFSDVCTVGQVDRHQPRGRLRGGLGEQRARDRVPGQVRVPVGRELRGQLGQVGGDPRDLEAEIVTPRCWAALTRAARSGSSRGSLSASSTGSYACSSISASSSARVRSSPARRNSPPRSVVKFAGHLDQRRREGGQAHAATRPAAGRRRARRDGVQEVLQ